MTEIDAPFSPNVHIVRRSLLPACASPMRTFLHILHLLCHVQSGAVTASLFLGLALVDKSTQFRSPRPFPWGASPPDTHT